MDDRGTGCAGREDGEKVVYSDAVHTSIDKSGALEEGIDLNRAHYSGAGREDGSTRYWKGG